MFNRLPKHPEDAHKGTFGKVMVIAGSASFLGAAHLVCEASYRVGAGLVTLASIPLVCQITAGKISEVTYLLLPNKIGIIAQDSINLIAKNLSQFDALVVGPGLGLSD